MSSPAQVQVLGALCRVTRIHWETHPVRQGKRAEEGIATVRSRGLVERGVPRWPRHGANKSLVCRFHVRRPLRQGDPRKTAILSMTDPHVSEVGGLSYAGRSGLSGKGTPDNSDRVPTQGNSSRCESASFLIESHSGECP